MDDPTFHEVANIFPLMEDEALAQLAADIAANGLREPIWRHRDGRIIDGRNRWLACRKAGVECHSHEYQGDDASLVAFVVSHNLHRRHLTESQRAMVAGRLATTSATGGNPALTPTSPLGEVDRNQAAGLLNVSPNSVTRARRVLREAEPEVAAAVDKGELSVAAAAKIAGHQPDEQRRQLSAHRERGGTDKRSKGTPKMKQEQPMPRLRVVHDRDDGLVEQVLSLLHRLREVSAKTDPAALHARVPERLMHNLDLSLETATEFLIGLREAHGERAAEKKNAAG